MAAKKKTSTPPASKQNIVKQGAKFGVVGVSNTLIDFTVFQVVSTLLGVPQGQVYLVKYLSGSIAMINSFYWNRRWVFKSKADVGSSGIKFLVSTLVSVWAIQPFMVHTFTATSFSAFGDFCFAVGQALHIVQLAPHTFTQEWVVKTAAFGMGVIGSAIWNFTMYKLWAFREK